MKTVDTVLEVLKSKHLNAQDPISASIDYYPGYASEMVQLELKVNTVMEVI